jgi:hypothetical protein
MIKCVHGTYHSTNQKNRGQHMADASPYIVDKIFNKISQDSALKILNLTIRSKWPYE